MPKPLDPNVLVIDVESTCWEPPEVQPQGAVSEIIEIGIAVVNIKDLKITDNVCIMIKPQKSKVSKFCTKLTTLTQEMVDTGGTFKQAMDILQNKYHSNDRTFVSWGDYDRKMFERNCKEYGVKYPFGPRHMNLKNSFTMFHGLEREPGMDTALENIGLKLDGTHHRGIDDARNIATIFLKTIGQFRAAPEMEDELRWRHELDAKSLEHVKGLEKQRIEILEKLGIKP